MIWSSATNSFLKGKLAVDTRFPQLNELLTRTEEGSYTGVSDLVITPVNLGWHWDSFISWPSGMFTPRWARIIPNAG